MACEVVCISRAPSPHLHSSLFFGALRGSWGHEPTLDRPVAPGEVEEGEGEVEKLSIPVPSGLHIVLAIKPSGIKLNTKETNFGSSLAMLTVTQTKRRKIQQVLKSI